MRRVLLAVFLCAGCRETPPEGAELTRSECSKLVQHVQSLEAADTGGLLDALHVGLRSGIEGCLGRGTKRAYRCVLDAQSVGDLRDCDSLFK